MQVAAACDSNASAEALHTILGDAAARMPVVFCAFGTLTAIRDCAQAFLSADESFEDSVPATSQQTTPKTPKSASKRVETPSRRSRSSTSSDPDNSHRRARSSPGALSDVGAAPIPSPGPASPGPGEGVATPSSSPQTPLKDDDDTVTVRDLDTGKQYVLEKVYKIKDLDTGKEFLVDGEHALEEDGGVRSLVQVDTGEKLTMAEFEKTIGLGSPLLREMSRRDGTSLTDSGEHDKSSDEEGQAKAKGAKRGTRWIKKGLKKLTMKTAGAGDDQSASTGDKKMGGPNGQSSSEPEYWNPESKSGKQVKVNVQRKIYKEYTDLKVVQELTVHKGAVWSMVFSLDGQYLATAGQDKVVRVWSVISYAQTTLEDTKAEDTRPFFNDRPYRLFAGHKADVLDLCWSKTQFLLSSSMDKTVRLWHISMNECLRVFNHSDFVTSIQFNPVDDKYFLSGSLDEKVRLWNIPEQTVTDWVNVHDMVTTTTFSPDGKKAVIGSYKGKCRFYSIEDNRFEYITQIDVKNARGKNSRGKKITGLTYMPGVDRFLLVTSNDSRIRMYDGFTLCCKYKGHRNATSQIASDFSPGGGFVACGSEDGCVYIWSTINTFIPSVNPFYTGYRKDKNSSFESFTAHSDIVTNAIFAPQNTRRTSTPALHPGMAPATKAAEALVKPSLKRLGVSSKSRADQEREEAQKAGEAAVAAAAAVGQIIVTSGYSGEIRVFENLGLPMWL